MSSELRDGDDATALRARLLAGELSCTDVARALLAAVGKDELHAWACLDEGVLLARASELDALDAPQRERLALFGVPVAIKDVFDTADLPTEYGSPIYAGHRPAVDAAAVARLRAAGALIAGKLKCAEFAWMTPPDTLNPLDHARTPGGSSNGSAAAVAAGLVPLATGSQTAGSINRPASYCGVLGYKPTFGRFDRAGVKLMSPTLDTVGLLARTVADLRLAGAALDSGLAASAAPSPAGATGTPRMAFARTPCWGSVEPEAAEAIETWLADARADGVAIEELELPGYEVLAEAQETIQRYESARSLAPELESNPDGLSPQLREALRDGAAMPPERHERAQHAAGELGPALAEQLLRYDAVITPSALGVPPLGLGFTGDPLFCRVWTLIGAPSLSLPLAWTASGLPAPLQLVGAPGADAAVLDAAERLLVRQ